MDLVPYLPHVNATLNSIAFLLIVCGLIAIKRRREVAHKRLMLTAVFVSALFLTSYLIYHFNAEPVLFQGEGMIRALYFTILISHIVLAVVQVPLILMTVHAGLKDRRPRHRKLARITTPIWLYVSLTGVVIYLFLYRMY